MNIHGGGDVSGSDKSVSKTFELGDEYIAKVWVVSGNQKEMAEKTVKIAGSCVEVLGNWSNIKNRVLVKWKYEYWMWTSCNIRACSNGHRKVVYKETKWIRSYDPFNLSFTEWEQVDHHVATANVKDGYYERE